MREADASKLSGLSTIAARNIEEWINSFACKAGGNDAVPCFAEDGNHEERRAAKTPERCPEKSMKSMGSSHKCEEQVV